MTTFNAGAATDKGRVRSNNQDSKLVVANLFAVADGMGGHRGGEVASAVALEALQSSLDANTTSALLESVAKANEAVYSKASSEPDLRGMGTTLTAVALVDSSGEERVAVVNVGDSRAYLLRGDSFEQLTEDHSLVESLVRQGRLTPTEAETHPQRNILTRALGIDSRVEVDAWELPAVTGDRYLLCSDGLFNEVDEDRIAATLRELGDPNEAADRLVNMANEGGGRDNITCVVVDVVEGTGNPATGATRTGTASEPDLTAYGGTAPPTAPTPVTDEPQKTSSVFAGEDTDQAATPPPAPAPAPQRTAEHPPVPPLPPEEPRPPVDDGGPPVRTRRFTWRVFVFVIALLALIAVVLGALWWYGRNTYYVGFDGRDRVTIFRGHPGGFLVFDPTVEQRTDIRRDELQRDGRDRVDGERSQSSLSAAEDFVSNLCRDLLPDGQSEECPDEGDDDTGDDRRTTTTTRPDRSPPTTSRR